MNEFLVGMQGDGVVIMKPIPFRLTKEQALNLAVYLVCMADESYGAEGGVFSNLLNKVIDD